MADMTDDARSYYAGGFRRTFGGVPCKVFSRRTSDGRYINAKDSPFYVTAFDHPKTGASRTSPASDETVRAIELKQAMEGIAAAARETAEPRDNVLLVDFTAVCAAEEPETLVVEVVAEPSNVIAVDFAAIAAAEEMGEVRAIVRGGFGSTAAAMRNRSPAPSHSAEIINMPHNAPEMPVERDEAPEVALEPETLEIAPVPSSGEPEAISPPPFRGTRAILEARDAMQRVQRRAAVRERLLRRYLAMRRQRTLDRMALAAAGDAVRLANEERDEARREAVKPPQHANEPEADAALIAQLQRERGEAAARVAAAEGREAELRRTFEASTARLAAKLEEMTGRALRAETAVRLARVAPLAPAFAAMAGSGGARLAGVRL